jgi:DeoR/GlpR family transcriptional regulator of sugar metabolism
VDELTRRFATSEVTIRKDLALLETGGLLLRRYGGAVALPSEMAVEPEVGVVSDRKLDIARAAAERIRDHNRIIIDSGTTTSGMIPLLGSKRGLVVMTNSLNVAAALRELENEPC